jgi:hypothetical protein
MQKADSMVNFKTAFWGGTFKSRHRFWRVRLSEDGKATAHRYVVLNILRVLEFQLIYSKIPS